ncbi:MAG TPA: hypothetical protein VF538_01180 [Pyrinomonadaceae bacterium]
MHTTSGSGRSSVLFMLALLLCSGAVVSAQSGRGAVRGYVAFEGVAYDDLAEKKVRAKIELRGSTEYNRETSYTAETNERGSYDIKSVMAGEYALRITSPGYAAYEIEVYIPSDFICSLAVVLKKHGK